jgi:hypothetical protein
MLKASAEPAVATSNPDNTRKSRADPTITPLSEGRSNTSRITKLFNPNAIIGAANDTKAM